MYRWTALIAFVVLVVALTGLILSSQNAQMPSYQEATEKHETKAPEEKKEKALWDSWFPDSIALYTFILVIFTGVLAFGGVIQLTLLTRAENIAARSAKAAQDAAAVANKALLATQRPWINAEIKIASDFIFGETEARVTFSYTLKNIGNAVATNIQVSPRLIPFQFGKVSGEPPNFKIEIPQTRPIAELKTLCEDQARLLDNPNAAEFVGGHVIFPNDSIPDAVNIHMLNNDINTARAQSAYKSLIPVLLFCVAYRSPFDKGTHYTGHAFNLFRRDPKSAGGAREITPDDGNVPANELMLMRLPFNSSIAN